MSDSLHPYGLQPTRLLCPWDTPGKNTGVGCQALLQGIFPTQRSNLHLLHCRWILYPLRHLGSLFISDNIQYLSFFCLTFSLSIMPSMSIHVFAKGKIVFLLWLSCILGCVCVCSCTDTTASLSINLLMDT